MGEEGRISRNNYDDRTGFLTKNGIFGNLFANWNTCDH